MDPDSKRLSVSVTDGEGRPVRDGGLAAWLTSIAPGRGRGEITVALVSDAQIRALNRRYRRKDAVTDVLSFPAEAGTRRAGRGAADATMALPLLGDLAIATGVARRQAKAAGHSFQTELRVLALHGLLHLLGYDHHGRTDHGRMARTEARLLRRGGVKAGLIERSIRQGSRQARS
ncbi:MAG TPA: rRNA maturation RNase YbeY [Vicinamibacterales bacterium]|nr:rRNA maturation RNase YbeY [Vicinamibacterales bacterium]